MFRSASVSRQNTIILKDLEPEMFLVQAMFDFAPQESEELEFKKGDIITSIVLTSFLIGIIICLAYFVLMRLAKIIYNFRNFEFLRF